MIADLRYSGAGPCVLLMVAVGVYLPKLPRLGLPVTDYHTKLNINQNEMTYINIITGLILAAVLSVPGAMQHEATQVGEELVVEEVKQVAYWRYNLTVLAGAKQETNYTPIMGSDEGCDDGGELPCVLRIEGEHGNIADLAAHLASFPTESDVAANAFQTKSE